MSSETPKSSSKRPLDSYLRYSAIGLQMALTILFMTWAGTWLDEKFSPGFPLFTLFLAILSVTGSLIYLVRTLTKP